MEQHPADHDLLIRLDEKVDGLIKSVEVLTNDHEARIRSLEKAKWKERGVIAAINFAIVVLGVVAAFLVLKK